jgi:uncharacterized protein (DUF2147 family)
VRPTLLALTLLVCTLQAASPVGRWRTFDDKTGKPRAVVAVYEQNGRLFGRIESSFNPQTPPKRCTRCTDERKDQVVVGMVIVRNLRPKGAEFTDGDILDPDNGSVYRCRMKLSPDGATLQVRGYIGFSLLGRSQSWTRLP